MYKFLIIFSIISFLGIVWYGIESYVDYKAEIISTNHILNHHLDMQNEAIKKNADNIYTINNSIITSV